MKEYIFFFEYCYDAEEFVKRATRKYNRRSTPAITFIREDYSFGEDKTAIVFDTNNLNRAIGIAKSIDPEVRVFADTFDVFD